MVFGYLFWLKRIPIHELTPNLCFNIPFHLYIHDEDLQQAFGTLTYGVNMYVPPILANRYILWYLFLAQTDTNPPTNSNLGYSIAFHLNIHDHWLEQAFGKHTSETKMYAPLIWANSSNHKQLPC